MKSFDSIGKIPKHPTKEAVRDSFDRTKEDTIGTELEARRLGLSEEEYEKQKRKDFSEKNSPIHSAEENAKFFEMKNFIEQWQKDFDNGVYGTLERIPENAEVVNNTLFRISDPFIAH